MNGTMETREERLARASMREKALSLLNDLPRPLPWEDLREAISYNGVTVFFAVFAGETLPEGMLSSEPCTCNHFQIHTSDNAPEPEIVEPARSLTPIERKLYAAIGSAPRTARAIIRESGYGYNSHSRTVLKRLCDAELIVRVSGGYKRPQRSAKPARPAARRPTPRPTAQREPAPRPLAPIPPAPEEPVAVEEPSAIAPASLEDLKQAILAALADVGSPLGRLAVHAALRCRGVGCAPADLGQALDELEDAGSILFRQDRGGKGYELPSTKPTP